jgi:superfamily II DNA or RNA helicase
MSIILKNMAQVNIPEDLREQVLKMFIHFNKHAEHIRTYRYKDGVAYLPPSIAKLRLVASMLDTDIEDQRSEGGEVTSVFTQNPMFTFREHQIDAAQTLLNRVKKENYMVLKAGCGCGKTVVMTYVAGYLGKKILILVDMGSLQSQWQEAFKLVWNKNVQIIDRNTKVFGDVCIATFQLLHFNLDLTMALRKEFGCLLLDEFHSTASETRREVLMKMDNQYRIGCTATLMKKGFSDEVLTDMVSEAYVEMVDHLELKPTVEFVESGVAFCSSSPDDWGKIQSALGKDLRRNKFIADLVAQQVRNGRKVLLIGVTTDSLKQVEFHLKRLPECKLIVYIGSTSLKQDLALKDKLASGAINVIMTVRKADKGIDLPTLDCMVLARPANNEAFIQQVVGRIVRAVPGKPNPILFDLVDGNSLAKGFARNRKKWYLKLNYSVKETET